MKATARIALASSLLAASAQATTYTVTNTYDHTNFFNGFTFFDETDPTHGYVDYASAATASSSGLAGYVNNMVYLGADFRTDNPSGGRASTRVTSTYSYEKGLLVADIQHMPVGCGVWPAFWTLGPNWPSGGEIDIIEGVNSQTTNSITLHTSPQCNMSDTGSLSSTGFTPSSSTPVDCGANGGYQGCSLTTTSTLGYGAGFNANGGGVYAMELSSAAIAVWFFPRGSAMAGALAAGGSAATSADTSSFGTPTARFSGCDIDTYFAAQQIIFDTTFCGDWAGNVWSTDATCSTLSSSCDSYVAVNPSAFVDAYWLINSVKVYQTNTSVKRYVKEGIVPRPFMA